MSNISLTTAKDMVDDYLNHPDKLAAPGGGTLKGLMVSKADMQALLDLNSDEYMIIFAVREADVGKPSSQQTFTTIMAGIDNGEIDVNALKDGFGPCPDTCANYDDVFL